MSNVQLRAFCQEIEDDVDAAKNSSEILAAIGKAVDYAKHRSLKFEHRLLKLVTFFFLAIGIASLVLSFCHVKWYLDWIGLTPGIALFLSFIPIIIGCIPGLRILFDVGYFTTIADKAIRKDAFFDNGLSPKKPRMPIS